MQTDPLFSFAEGKTAERQASSNYAANRSVAYESRASLFRQTVESNKISIQELRSLAYDGVPDEKGLRATVWKVSTCSWCLSNRAMCALHDNSFAVLYCSRIFLQLLLGYLPLDRSQWEKTLQRKRAEYEQFCEVSSTGFLCAQTKVHFVLEDQVLFPGCINNFLPSSPCFLLCLSPSLHPPTCSHPCPHTLPTTPSAPPSLLGYPCACLTPLFQPWCRTWWWTPRDSAHQEAKGWHLGPSPTPCCSMARNIPWRDRCNG